MEEIINNQIDNIKSNKNKFELWNLFNEKKYFDNIPQGDVEDVKNVFETSINSVYTSHVNSNNKNINLKSINEEIEYVFKRNMSIFLEQLKAKKVEEHRINELNVMMEKKQNELNNIIKPQRPDEIDFTVKNDEPFKENLDEIINKTLQDRQSQLQDIVSSYPQPKDETEKNKNDENELESTIININDINKINDSNISLDDTNFPLNTIDNNKNNNLSEKIDELTNISKKIIESQIILIDLIEKTNSNNDYLKNELNLIKEKIEKNRKKKISKKINK